MIVRHGKIISVFLYCKSLHFLSYSFLLIFFQKQDNKSTMWSDSRVNISLDSLIPTLRNDKPQQPSMNQLQSQTPCNSPQQAGYNLGSMQMSNPGQMNYMNQSSNMGMMSSQGHMSPSVMNMSGGIRNSPMGGNTGIYGAQPMGMMGSRPLSSPQGFSSNSFSTYKGIS